MRQKARGASGTRCGVTRGTLTLVRKAGLLGPTRGQGRGQMKEDAHDGAVQNLKAKITHTRRGCVHGGTKQSHDWGEPR
jgi:hypothetical protein